MIRPPSRRRAMVSIIMLVALIVVGLMAAGVLRVLAARRATIRAEERALQVEALVGSGIDRALARLAADPAYPGETWEIPAADLLGRGPARVAIRLTPDASNPADRRLVVIADLLASAQDPVRRSRTLTIPAPPPAR